MYRGETNKIWTSIVGALSNFFAYSTNKQDQQVYELAVKQGTAIYSNAFGPG